MRFIAIVTALLLGSALAEPSGALAKQGPRVPAHVQPPQGGYQAGRGSVTGATSYQASGDPATGGTLLAQRHGAGAQGGADAQGAHGPTGSGAGQLAQPGRRYEAGTRIDAPWAGVSFTVPDGYYAGYAPDLSAFLVVSDTLPGLIMIDALSQLPLDNGLSALMSTFQTDQLTLIPQGQPRLEGDTVRALFTAQTRTDQGTAYLMGRAGPARNALMAAAIGATSEQQQLQGLLEGMMASALLTDPDPTAAGQWRQRLAGAQLGISSSSGSGGYDGSSVYSSSRTTLDLCSDGSYAYHYSYFLSASVPGMGASDRDRDEDQGRWQVVFGLLGPYLALDSYSTGQRSHIALLEADGSLHLDGTRVRTERSGLCN